MAARHLSAGLTLATLLLAGCADFGGPISSSQRTALSPEERRLQEVETKTAQILRRLDSMNQGQVDQDLTRVREEIRILRGDIEKVRFDLDARDRGAKELYADLDRRLQRIESGGGAVGAPAVSSAPVPGNTPGTLAAAPPPRSAVATPEEERAYLGTFDQLKNGKYDEAIKGFAGMLEQWPQGRYADNALYWMGEAQLIKRDYAGAATSFQGVADRFPSSAKMADSLYKLGVSQFELKRSAEARSAWQRVIREFPTSNAANLAKQKLDQLGG